VWADVNGIDDIGVFGGNEDDEDGEDWKMSLW